MKGYWQRFVRDEQGITALETAIILIAFVVVASVFAFTILSAGTSSTQQAKDAITGGLAQVSGSLEVRGSVIATDADSNDQVESVVFTLATVTGGEAVDLTAWAEGGVGTPVPHTLIIDYRDASQREVDIEWAVEFLGSNDADSLLEDRELAQITVDTSGLTTPLGANESFVLEIKPPTGGTVPLERTTPPEIEAIMDLN